MDLYENCHLCARNCGVNRHENLGYCRESSEIFLSRAALHMWEEPPISGTNGSGTIFFSGCSLSCVFCQNADISRGRSGRSVSISRLAEIMLELQNKGAHNINLVTPTHYIPSLAEAIPMARKMGLTIPIVYNTGSYDNVDALRTLSGLVDIYLPDLKYYNVKTAESYSHAGDYPTVARDAIAEMYRQVGRYEYSSDGTLKKGVLIRHLVLPRGRKDSVEVLKRIKSAVAPSDILMSIMSQYTPDFALECGFEELHRRVTSFEYGCVVDAALEMGFDGFMQSKSSAVKDYTPDFR